MKNKILSSIITGIFSLIFLIGFASATLTLSGIPTLSKSGGSFNFNIASDESETVVLSASSISDGFGNYITFTPKTISINNETLNISMSYEIDSDFNFEFEKSYSTSLIANGSESGAVSSTLVFEESSFCNYNNPGNLKIKISNIKVVSGFGEENEWLPFDKVEVEVEVQNKGDEDIDDVLIEWGLYNPNSGKWTINVDEEKDFSLKENAKKTIVLSFTINDDMDEDLEELVKGTYKLYIKATGEIDNSSGISTCNSVSKDVKLIIEKDFVIISNFEYPETVQCGSEFHFSADVWNIGSRDQGDVYVKILNRELGIDKKIEIGDIDSFDKESLDFYFTIPSDAKEKKYSLTISIYNEDDEIFQNDYNDDSATFEVPFNVEGGCAKAQATVSATLYSGGEAGKPLVIKAIVTNTGTKQTPYSLNAAGYSVWASSVKVEPNSFSLNAGESKEILITFDVNKDSVGAQLFNLEILSQNQLIANQPVEVPIKKAKLSIPKISMDNWHLWAIGALNVILVILIIVIAIRISRK